MTENKMKNMKSSGYAKKMHEKGGKCTMLPKICSSEEPQPVQ